ncbi:hypothetical protein PAL_GLEAN10018013 [Pteropus alecto]|uniref:Uncharacterized protein n=1 Tax=Pteropus alecto TaxID=9402 RepID=L5KYC7_PTEAL|nr:hypothetical protein PAL_GLEAN10018013 [Pteropus alecto]
MKITSSMEPDKMMWEKERVLDASSSVQAAPVVPAAVHAGLLGQWKMKVCKVPHCSLSRFNQSDDPAPPWPSKALNTN